MEKFIEEKGIKKFIEKVAEAKRAVEDVADYLESNDDLKKCFIEANECKDFEENPYYFVTQMISKCYLPRRLWL